MRLTIVTESLRGGGVARFISIFANYWAERGWTITLLLYDHPDTPSFYDLDPRIACIHLNIMWHSPILPVRFWQHLKRIWTLRRAIKHSQPDCVLSTMVSPNVLSLIAVQGLHLPIIVSERTNPFRYPLNKAGTLLRLWCYRRANRVIMQSAPYIQYFPPAIQKLCQAIPNPVILPQESRTTRDKPSARTDPCSIVAMGRLEHHKGFDLLLRAFARVASDYPDWMLTIWGEGAERSRLDDLCAELGLAGRIRLPGTTPDPFAKLQQADLFVLSSRYEGFPNVLAEAMACGLPVIAYECGAGVRDIIRDGVDGVLVPPEDVDGLVAAMDRLISDAQERHRMAARAPEVLERFSLKKVMGMWEQVITDAHQKHRIIGSVTPNELGERDGL